MKKSNKLLLGALITVVLLLAGIHIALYAKYKSGNYTIYHLRQRAVDTTMQQFPNVSYVMIRNVPGATIQFGDTATVEKDRTGIFQYEQKGDSLFITGRRYYNDQLEVTPRADFILPYNVTIETDSISRLILQSNQILKAKITTVPNNP